MKKIVLGMFFLLMLAFVSAASAQEPASEQTCTPEEWAAYQQSFTDIIPELTTSENPIDILLLLDAIINTVRATCTGATYSSEELGTEAIIGPIAFSGTIYQATLTSEYFSSVQITEIAGDCDKFNLLSVAEMTGGTANTIYEFSECVAMFEVNSSKPWTFAIERIR